MTTETHRTFPRWKPTEAEWPEWETEHDGFWLLVQGDENRPAPEHWTWVVSAIVGSYPFGEDVEIDSGRAEDLEAACWAAYRAAERRKVQADTDEWELVEWLCAEPDAPSYDPAWWKSRWTA